MNIVTALENYFAAATFAEKKDTPTALLLTGENHETREKERERKNGAGRGTRPESVGGKSCS